MNLTSTEVQEIIHGKEHGIRIGEQGFRTPQTKRLEDSLKSKEDTWLKKKDRKPGGLHREDYERKKRRRLKKNAFARGGNTKRSPQEKEKMGEEIVRTLKNTMDMIVSYKR
ncbi:hypothetical protein TSAR_000208 [Trichomalopsis sarcophagae]|uniref:Uncharacterized protein n=1 Tax=Trichomalopsis sarcophagae TaxID=543379 RepID=A0A232FDL9_9HYME|nr:hypothetical protein TSAR_000208 [Trichomalopsis sarcophagae]